jgi:hypothetical protein
MPLPAHAGGGGVAALTVAAGRGAADAVGLAGFADLPTAAEFLVSGNAPDGCVPVLSAARAGMLSEAMLLASGSDWCCASS